MAHDKGDRVKADKIDRLTEGRNSDKVGHRGHGETWGHKGHQGKMRQGDMGDRGAKRTKGTRETRGQRGQGQTVGHRGRSDNH